MKHHNFIATGFLFAVIASMGLTSCEDDDYEHVHMQYILYCSEDLLKFVTPEVTYTDENGKEQIITLSDSDFDKSSSSYEWSKDVEYDSFNVNGRISVKYISTGFSETAGEEYYFRHVVSMCGSSSGCHGDEEISDSYPSYVVTITSPVSSDEVSEYITNLTKKTDSESWAVDGNGEITVKSMN